MMGQFLPMLSYRDHEVDPGMSITHDEGEARRVRLRPVLRAAVGKAGMATFLEPHEKASLIGMIAPSNNGGKWEQAERSNALNGLLDPKAGNPPYMTLVAPTVLTVNTKEADQLDEYERSTCIALRKEDRLVVPGKAAHEGVGVHIVITWPKDAFQLDKGKYAARVRVHRIGEDSVRFSATSSVGISTDNVIVRGLPDVVLNRLFEPIKREGSPMDHRLPSNTIRLPKAAGEIPEVMQLQLAAFAQYRLRAQVLVTAAGPCESSRPLTFENMQVKWLTTGNGSKVKKPRMQVKAYFHKTSATCFCGAHNLPAIEQRMPNEKFSGKCEATMSMDVCGQSIGQDEDSQCLLHRSKTVRNWDFAPGVCCTLCSVSFNCHHETANSVSGKGSAPGMWLPCALDPLEAKELSMLLGVVARFDKQSRPLFDGKLASDHKEKLTAMVLDAVTEMDGLVAKFDKYALQQGQRTSDADLLALDLLAVDRLRTGNLVQAKLIGYQKAAKMARRQGEVSQEEKKLAKFHHWIFPRHDSQFLMKNEVTLDSIPPIGKRGSPTLSVAPSFQEDAGQKRQRIEDPTFDYEQMTEYIDPHGLAEARQQLDILMANPSIPKAQRDRGLHFQQFMEVCDREYGDEVDGPLGLPARPLVCKYRSRNGGGRLYPTGMPKAPAWSKGEARSVCIQAAPRELRPFMCCKWGRDFDMKNAQPEMLRQMSMHLKWTDNRESPHLPEMEKWCADREEYIEHVAEVHSLPTDEQRHFEYRKDVVKELMIRLMFGGAYKSFINDLCSEFRRDPDFEPHSPRVVALAAELLVLRKVVFESTRWMAFVEKDRARLIKEGKKKDQDAVDRSVFARIAQKTENDVLTVMRKFLMENGWTPLSLCFDGLIVQHRPARTLDLNAMNERILRDTRFELKIVEKPLYGAEYPVLTLDRAS